MKPIESQIRRFRRRLARVLVLERGLRFLAVTAFAGGSVILAFRAGLGASYDWLPAGLAATLAAALGVAVAGALRSLPAESAVRALLDRHQRRGGLLMTAAETDLGPWHGEMKAADLPRLRWRSGPAWTLLAGSAAFVAVSFLVPARTLDASAPRPLEIGEEVAELKESLQVLEEEGLLAEDEAERLDLELETLAEEASGDDPARAWETLDHLREIAEQTAEEASEAALTEGEQLAAAAEVAAALEDGAGDPQLEAETLEELAVLAAKAAAESRLLDHDLAEALAQAAESGDLEQLMKALGSARSAIAAQLDRLYQAGLIDLGTLLDAKEAQDLEEAALAAFLEENALEASGAYCKMPGRGGVTRGRGDAAMTWGEPSSRDGTAFEEQVLDPASVAALKKSGLIGLRAADPSSDGRQPRPASGTSGLDPAASGGGAAYTRTVLPRHRGAVRRFFERSEDDRTPPPREP